MSFLWGDWWEFLDEETGRFYYYNESTQQSLWVKPEMPIQTPTGDSKADSGEEQRKKEEEEKRKNEELLKQQEVEKKELEAKEEAEKNKKELEIKEQVEKNKKELEIKEPEVKEEVKKLSEESPQKKVNSFENFKLSKPWERNIDDPIPEKVRSPSIVAQSKMVRFLKF
jgi:flagellar biosynthesis GTPase FlhF